MILLVKPSKQRSNKNYKNNLLKRKQHVTDDEGKRNWKRRNHSLFGVGAAQDRVLLKIVRRDLLHKSTSKEQTKGEKCESWKSREGGVNSKVKVYM